MALNRLVSGVLAAALVAALAYGAVAAWRWRVAEDETRMFDAAKRKKAAEGLPGKLRRLIEVSGSKLAYQEFISLWAFCIAGPALLGLMLGAGLETACALGLAGAVLPVAWLKRLQKKNASRFSEDLGDALPLVAANLRAGMSLRQSLAPVARNLDEPVRGEFEILSRDLDQGVPVEVALTDMAERNGNKDLDLLACAVATQQEMGGNLADIVDTTADTIRTRAQLRRTVQSKTSEQRASAKFLLVFPLVIVAGMCAAEESFRTFYSQPAGWGVITAALVIEAVGYMAVQKMTDIQTD